MSSTERVQLLAFLLLMSAFVALQLVSVKSGDFDRNPRDVRQFRRVGPMVTILAALAVFPWSMLI
jgi:hypothetical protein